MTPRRAVSPSPELLRAFRHLLDTPESAFTPSSATTGAIVHPDAREVTCSGRTAATSDATDAGASNARQRGETPDATAGDLTPESAPSATLPQGLTQHDTPDTRCNQPVNGGRHICRYHAGHNGPCYPHINAGSLDTPAPRPGAAGQAPPGAPGSPERRQWLVGTPEGRARLRASYGARSDDAAGVIHLALAHVEALTAEVDALRPDAERWRACQVPSGEEATADDVARFSGLLHRMAAARREADVLRAELARERQAAALLSETLERVTLAGQADRERAKSAEELRDIWATDRQLALDIAERRTEEARRLRELIGHAASGLRHTPGEMTTAGVMRAVELLDAASEVRA